MNSRSLFAALLVPLSLVHSAAAADYEVGIMVESIELAERAATKLLRAHGGKSDATELRDALRGMVEAGDATVAATAYVRTKSGQRGKVESVHEFIYPTEFDPPEVPQQLTGPIAAGADITTHANPTAFEMRPVGLTLEVEPAVRDDGVTIDVKIAPEQVEFIGFKAYGKDESEVKQPIFYAMKTSTALAVADGSYALLGVHTPKSAADGELVGDKDRRVLLLMRASIVGKLGRAAAAEDAGVPK